jgi:hypothetical protein
MSHSFFNPQKIDGAMKARVISVVPYVQVDNYFDGVVTGDESWFVYIYPSDHMFAAGRNEVVPKEKQMIRVQKVMITFSPGCV